MYQQVIKRKQIKVGNMETKVGNTTIEAIKGTILSYWCIFADKKIIETVLEVTENGVMMESLATYDAEEIESMKVVKGKVTLTRTRVIEATKQSPYFTPNVLASSFDIPYSDY